MRNKFWRRFGRNPLTWFGVGLVVFFALVAAFAPLIAPPPQGTTYVLSIPSQIPRASYYAQPSPPSAGHVFGTTQGQYDLFFGVVWGSRSAFMVGFLVVALGVFVGLILGSLAGYYGGFLDSAIMRLTDVFFSVPALVLAMVIVTILGSSLFNVMWAIAVVSWPVYARLIRGEVLKAKNLDYVDAARGLGVSNRRIILRHVLPNTIAPLIVVASLDIGAVVLLAAALSFLGIGAPTGFPGWGQLINLARAWLIGPPGEPFKFWYVTVYPGVAIVLFVLGWNLLGDALRDALDVRDV